MNRDEIFQGVRACLAQALDRPSDGIRLEDRIIGDLGADSLDLLDITFKLEQRFEVKLSPREIERRVRAKLGEVQLEQDGVYTPRGLEELRKAMPEIPAGELAEGLTVNHMPRLLRAASLVNLVARVLEEKP